MATTTTMAVNHNNNNDCPNENPNPQPKSPLEAAAAQKPTVTAVRSSSSSSSLKTIAMPVSKKTWQVWKTISRLEEILLQDDSNNINNDDAGAHAKSDLFPLYPASRELVAEIVSILRTLATQHEGKIEWKGLLNKSTLLHEVEESILAIHFLQQEWKNRRSRPFREIVLVDVCCGKGVFSLLASYVFASASAVRNNKKNNNNNQQDEEQHNFSSSVSVSKIIMLDKDPKLRWDHIHASNTDSNSNGRPSIECWPRFNLHETDEVVERLAAQLTESSSSSSSSSSDGRCNRELALVGIHLCKTLSPACIGIANLLGPEQCPHLVLAPCCLPRVVVQSKYSKNNNKTKVLEVLQYETLEQKEERHRAQERRAMAMVRGKGGVSTMDGNDGNDNGNENKNKLMGACWKCGEFGHVKADCPSNQSTGKPRLVKPPTLALPVIGILEQDRPFGYYCDLLSTSIQRQNVTVMETGLTNNHVSSTNNSKKQKANNWNRDRKSMYIVASEKVSPIEQTNK